MGFLCKDQQRVKLSEEAFLIVENDCISFGRIHKNKKEPSLGSFINTIFCNTYESAIASITTRMEERKSELSALQEGMNSEEVSIYLKRILDKEHKQLQSKVEKLLNAECSYGRTFNPISLNKNTREILENSHEAEEEIYNGKASKYIRAVMEEYASYESIKRKEIYFKEKIDTLKKYIKEQAVIEIRYANSTRHNKMQPLLIQPDKNRQHLYVAGISSDGKKKSPVPGRIDQIYSMNPVYHENYSSFELQKLKKEVKKQCDQQGIQYLIGKPKRIRIKLTKKGVKNYRQWTFQRPWYSDIEEGDIYVFEDIPEYQIEVYFFKFGADAVVLEPEGLKKKFYEKYVKAFEAYNKC